MDTNGKRSLLAEAWHRTELLGPKKIVTTVGAGLLTLIWNYEMGLRPLQLTVWFGICVVAAWLSLTVLEFCGHLTIGWSRNKWAQLKAEIAHEVASVKSESDKTSQKRYVATYPDEVRTEQIVERLKNNRGEWVLIWSSIGDPESYRYGEFLSNLLKQPGYQVTHEPVRIDADQRGLFFGLPYSDDIPEEARHISRALAAAGISFEIVELHEHSDWYIGVGHSI
jgi:hypothetical protein